MPTLKLTETYLSSSIIVMPTVNFENFGKNLSDYWNLPDFIDQTLAVDPPDEDGIRQYPEYSFISIEQIHDGCLYPHDDVNDSLELDNVIYPLIAKGTEFKMQYVQFHGAGVQYNSFVYNSQGEVNSISDDPMDFNFKKLNITK